LRVASTSASGFAGEGASCYRSGGGSGDVIIVVVVKASTLPQLVELHSCVADSHAVSVVLACRAVDVRLSAQAVHVVVAQQLVCAIVTSQTADSRRHEIH